VPVTAPSDRRFLRAQVKPGRRHRPWQAWIRLARVVAVAAVAAWLGWLGLMSVARSGSLSVRTIAVSGNRRLSAGEVRALVDGLRGRNILSVDLEEWRGRVLACSWVAEAIVRRALPSTIEVIVAERTPLAIGRIGEELYLVDGQGAIIDEFGPHYADLDLPILDGLATGTAGDGTDERRAALAGRLLDALRPHPDLAARVSQVDVSDPHNAVVIVDQDPARVRLGEERFVERLRSYVEIAPSLRDRVPDIDYVDLRFGERWVVGSQEGRTAGTGQRTAAAR
jgi:cell division protein FtsQ